MFSSESIARILIVFGGGLLAALAVAVLAKAIGMKAVVGTAGAVLVIAFLTAALVYVSAT